MMVRWRCLVVSLVQVRCVVARFIGLESAFSLWFLRNYCQRNPFHSIDLPQCWPIAPPIERITALKSILHYHPGCSCMLLGFNDSAICLLARLRKREFWNKEVVSIIRSNILKKTSFVREHMKQNSQTGEPN